ncbi:hypothetical protein L484_016923 [Morus notabilis]|uniref:Reverse transcriptase Ty1/copia-type domain-containing protein n=1 Tax=Morus notabilis TaxID=981085 RepID=W9SK37_9ROSA|nr:hypothetical protein L484_016923 [Morus notabilis]
MFIKHSDDGKIAVLIVYVDDIILTGDNSAKMSHLKESLASEFEIKDLGSLKYFLGMEVARSKDAKDGDPAIYRILRYLKSTLGKGLLSEKHEQKTIEAYTNADWAGSVTDRRSTSGYCTYVWGNLVTWRSKKQSVVARSSAEAEYRAMAHGAYNQYSHDLEMVCAILCAGLYPNVVQCKRRGKRTAFYTKEVGKVDIHPASVNAGVHLFPLPYMVYSEKVKTTSIYIRDSTNISDYALLLFGGNLIPSKTGEGIEMLGGYLHFSASKSVLELIRKLRGELDNLLNRKIEEPSFDISREGKAVVAAAIELLHSQNISSTRYGDKEIPESFSALAPGRANHRRHRRDAIRSRIRSALQGSSSCTTILFFIDSDNVFAKKHDDSTTGQVATD